MQQDTGVCEPRKMLLAGTAAQNAFCQGVTKVQRSPRHAEANGRNRCLSDLVPRGYLGECGKVVTEQMD